jgi:UDP:flavonoid glycosyltransferase YjiC (YdhE family)
MKQIISFVVCSNGYGHLKRVMLVVNEILRIKPEQAITIFCADEHRVFAQREINFKSNSIINFDTSLSMNEISWLSPSTIKLTQYKQWADDLLANLNFQSSSLVVSDNHVLPARMHHNPMLMGSFLWHDATLISSPDIEVIRKEEIDYLLEHKPDLICVGDMVMPGIVGQTRPIRMPWFCSKHEGKSVRPHQRSFLVTGGGTELINETLLQVIDSVSKSNQETLFFLDSKLFRKAAFKNRENIHLFGFEDDHFASLSGVICRPGVGILTDCVRYNLPAIVLNDSYNLEIEYNANCVNYLEIGKSIDSYDTSIEKLSLYVSEIINNTIYLKKFTNQLKGIQGGGATKAAETILQKLKTHE